MHVEQRGELQERVEAAIEEFSVEEGGEEQQA